MQRRSRLSGGKSASSFDAELVKEGRTLKRCPAFFLPVADLSKTPIFLAGLRPITLYQFLPIGKKRSELVEPGFGAWSCENDKKENERKN